MLRPPVTQSSKFGRRWTEDEIFDVVVAVGRRRSKIPNEVVDDLIQIAKKISEEE